MIKLVKGLILGSKMGFLTEKFKESHLFKRPPALSNPLSSKNRLRFLTRSGTLSEQAGGLDRYLISFAYASLCVRLSQYNRAL
jgi:hypothetical protein